LTDATKFITLGVTERPTSSHPHDTQLAVEAYAAADESGSPGERRRDVSCITQRTPS